MKIGTQWDYMDAGDDSIEVCRRDFVMIGKDKIDRVSVPYSEINSVNIIQAGSIGCTYIVLDVKGKSYPMDVKNIKTNPYHIALYKDSQINASRAFKTFVEKKIKRISDGRTDLKGKAEKNTNNMGNISVADEILKLKNLLDAGAIEKDEYEIIKKSLISGIGRQNIGNAFHQTDGLSNDFDTELFNLSEPLKKEDFNVFENGKTWNFIDKTSNKDGNFFNVYTIEDDFHTFRGIDFLSSYEDVLKCYGDTKSKNYSIFSVDIYLSCKKTNEKVAKVLYRVERYLEYEFVPESDGIQNVSIRFYYDQHKNIVAIAYYGGTVTGESLRELFKYLTIDIDKCIISALDQERKYQIKYPSELNVIKTVWKEKLAKEDACTDSDETSEKKIVLSTGEKLFSFR